MLKEIILPEWIKGIGTDELNNVILTDDMDSLFSYYLLKQKFPSLKVVGYYDFETLRITKQIKPKNTLWIDCDMSKENLNSIGNHRITEYKDNNINMNMYLKQPYKGDYKCKFPFNTAMTVLFLFYSKFEIEKMSDDLIRFILAIDSGHLGYYKDGGKWKQHHELWLKEMKFERFLNVLEKSTLNDFEKIQDEYDMEEKLFYKEDMLKTRIDIAGIVFAFGIDLLSLYHKISLPMSKKFKKQYVHSNELRAIDKENILSMAETFKNKFAITCIE